MAILRPGQMLEANMYVKQINALLANWPPGIID